MKHQGPTYGWSGKNLRRVVPLALALAVSVSVADARSRDSRGDYARRQAAFDGAWSVLIQSETGPCAGTYRYGVEIVDGAVTHEGTPYGRVAPNGNVRVRLSLGDQQAEGVGRLSRGVGSGVWRGVGQSGPCTGRWFAERREGTYGAGR